MLDDVDTVQPNKAMKSQFLKVVIFVHKNLVQTKMGAERHDLLAYLVKDVFHLSNSLGMQLKLLSNREGVTDADYCTRTLQFEMTTPNSVKPFNTNQYEFNSIELTLRFAPEFLGHLRPALSLCPSITEEDSLTCV